MKGVVVEKEGNKVIILTKEGQFIKVRNKYQNCTIGKEIIMVKKSIQNPKVQVIKNYGFRYVAAIILCFLITSFGYSVYAQPVGYINIDINPSIQLAYNRFNRIISIKGNNEDGENMVASLEAIKGEKIKESIAKVVVVAKEKHYMDEKPAVTLTFVGDDKEIDKEQIVKELKQEQAIEKNLEWTVLNRTQKQYEEAQKEKQSLPKEQLNKDKKTMINNKKDEKLTSDKVKIEDDKSNKKEVIERYINKEEKEEVREKQKEKVKREKGKREKGKKDKAKKDKKTVLKKIKKAIKIVKSVTIAKR